MHDLIKNRRINGTTVLALKYRDGIVIAGDRRGSYGHLHDDVFIKVQDMENLTFIACSGTSAYIDELEKTLKSARKYWEETIGEPIFIDGQANLLQAVLKENFERLNVMMYMLGYYAVPILAGYDPFLKTGRVFEFDETGGMYEKKNFVVSGSGGQSARIILDDRWEVGLEEADAVELAIRAVMRASCDNYTSPGTLAPITVYSVSKSGKRFLPEKRALRLAWRLHKKDMNRRGEKSCEEFFTGKD
jgi:proteasome beta subunit